MSLSPRYSDPIDQFSIPIKTESLRSKDGTVLGKLITRIRRENSDKPSRTLAVAWDSRMPLIQKFTVEYSYIVRFNKSPNTQPEPAGRHYHKAKNELMTAAHGKFKVVLEDRKTKQQAECLIDSDARDTAGNAIEQSVYVPAGVAHAVQPIDDGMSSLLVIADHPGTMADEFPYDIDIS